MLGFVFDPSQPTGCYSLTVAGIDKANLPQAAIKRFSNYPIPVVRLARLAVDRGAQGCGLGEDLIMDALTRCLRAAREIGIAAVLVDVKHEQAKGFYARYEYESLSGRPLTLWLPMASVRRLFGEE